MCAISKARRAESTVAVVVRLGICEIALCQCASPAPSTYTGSRGNDRARAALVTTTAPPPSVTKQQSSARNGEASTLLAITSETDNGSRTKALGFSCAHRRAATATSASCSSVVPYSYM